ncbi:uncharacterized protein [Diabrotica undecimpunctata]|uniref:uncharacterized protein n=1 Tax=Diabrotica undecimpunctata TaxID=50387 RepID=UPI003B636A12
MSSSTDSAEELTPKKRSKLRAFSSTEKSVIYNIYKSTTESRPEALISEILKQTASTSGVGEASVYRIIREQNSTGGFSSPKKNKPRKTILHKIDDFDKTAIRRIVHQFFFRNEIPTIDKVLAAVNDDESLPNFKRSTFHKFLKSLDFKYVRRGRNSALLEREEIILWRRNFLKSIKKFREENRKIYYLDETWVNAGHTKSHVWVDETVKSSRQAFLSGLKNPSGKGK